MTSEPMPITPVVTTDPLLETISGAVTADKESPTVLRIGVVAAIMEGSQITVKISGSEVLIDCSYLFGQYLPLMGDRVIVFKQDSQWFCIGQMSGAIGSNTAISNSSFEDGAPGVIPTGWTLNVVAAGAGVPTFLAATAGTAVVSGKQIADFGTISAGAGTSIADAFSPVAYTTSGTNWTGAYWLVGALVGSVPPQFSDLDFYIQFLDVTSAVIVEYNLNSVSVDVDVLSPLYRRPNLGTFPTGKVNAPAGTDSVRVKIRATFRLPAASFFNFLIDHVILRQVD